VRAKPRSIGNIRGSAQSRRLKQRRQGFGISCLTLLACGPKRRFARNAKRYPTAIKVAAKIVE